VTSPKPMRALRRAEHPERPSVRAKSAAPCPSHDGRLPLSVAVGARGEPAHGFGRRRAHRDLRPPPLLLARPRHVPRGVWRCRKRSAA
jgi:hypothetical protein